MGSRFAKPTTIGVVSSEKNGCRRTRLCSREVISVICSNTSGQSALNQKSIISRDSKPVPLTAPDSTHEIVAAAHANKQIMSNLLRMVSKIPISGIIADSFGELCSGKPIGEAPSKKTLIPSSENRVAYSVSLESTHAEFITQVMVKCGFRGNSRTAIFDGKIGDFSGSFGKRGVGLLLSVGF